MKIIGITGHPASGKTFVGSIFRSQAIPIINIDKVIAETFAPGTITHKELINTIGTNILNINGSINYKQLIFLMNKENWIKNIVNWVVADNIENTLNKIINIFEYHNINFTGIETMSLFSSVIEKYIDIFILVKCNDSIKFERLYDAGFSIQAIKQIIDDNKIVIKNKIDYYIDNSGTKENTKKQVLRLHEEIIKTSE